LQALMEHCGQPVQWRDLVAATWQTKSPESGRDMLKTTIRRLRLKLGNTDTPFIVAVRGEGYLIPSFAKRR